MPNVLISNGELVDKLTILDLKILHIEDHDKKSKAMFEFKLLLPHAQIFHMGPGSINYERLLQVNNQLWNVEDQLRLYEKNRNFGDDFVHLARSVYKLNDKRSAIKKEINTITESEIMEVKSYEEY
jgi:hypothetical protein